MSLIFFTSSAFTSDLLLNYLLIFLLILWLFTSRDNENIAAKLFFRKTFIVFESFLFMLYSKDGKGIGPKYNPDPARVQSLNGPIIRKTIIFLRHGESDWNNVFNKGFNLSFPGRLIKSIINELMLMFAMDSIFLDSPLNTEGIEQALELRRFLEKAPLSLAGSGSNKNMIQEDVLATLRGEDGTSSVIVTSTLRRSISTTVLSLWPRIEKTQEKVHLLSSLQEISRNVDTRSLSAANTVANLPFNRVNPHCSGKRTVEDSLDVSENYGNKTRSFYGIKRLRSFAEWTSKCPETTIIVGGHSLWFKYFFQTYLPHASTHEAKNKKIINSGVVSFTLLQGIDLDQNVVFAIDPDSILTIYGGFEKEKTITATAGKKKKA